MSRPTQTPEVGAEGDAPLRLTATAGYSDSCYECEQKGVVFSSRFLKRRFPNS